MTANRRGKLPFMKTMDDAIAVSLVENDNFYVSAFMIEAWLGGVTLGIVAEYAEKKLPAKRSLQQGLASRLFDEAFGHAGDAEIIHLYQSLLRFAEYSDPQSRILLKAYGAMSLDLPVATWPEVGSPVSKGDIQKATAFMRMIMRRICDWAEAYIHAQTHLFYHFAPVAFDPDSENRELAIIGIQQRNYPEMDAFQRAWWEWHHGEAAERLQDPSKWVMVGQGMMDHQTKFQSYPGLDARIVSLWPLVRRHNWTFRDLMMVLRSVDSPWLTYPCEREQGLATYCINVLGLRKSSKGRSSKTGTPKGIEVARMLCHREEGSDSS